MVKQKQKKNFVNQNRYTYQQPLVELISSVNQIATKASPQRYTFKFKMIIKNRTDASTGALCLRCILYNIIYT